VAGPDQETIPEGGGVTMPFPDADRVLYEVNPLDEVICQIRFSPVLKIDTEPPANFQEDIRGEYPDYESKLPVRLSANIPQPLAELFAGELLLGGQKTHEFTSRDKIWKVSLTRNFVALTTNRYRRWDEFRRRLESAILALTRWYTIPYFTRVGLRYQDVIDRSVLGLEGVSWNELLNPAITGPLGDPKVTSDVLSLQTVAVVTLPDCDGKAQMKTSLVEHKETKEQAFLIDSDYFTEQQVELSDVLSRADCFNREARRFFRWCITDRLHQAMRPSPVPPA
jgi:uncharacterized protein (TIGR04255 family)